MTVAALYIDTRRGPYAQMDGVDAWGVDRDARLYDGPWPVVAHPPCEAWGAFRWRARDRYRDCGPRAVEQVRSWGGGCLSIRWARGSGQHALCLAPGASLIAGGGYTIEVEQVRWGHPALKPTWLYIVGCADLPPVPPMREPTHRIADGGRQLPHLPKTKRHITPPELAVWLVDTARRCGRQHD